MRKSLGIIATLTALAAIIGLGAPTLAAPAKTGPSGTLSLGVSGVATAGTPLFSKGDTVRMTASFSGLRKQDTVRVQILCMQDIGVVYADATTLSSSPQVVAFTLGQNSTSATSVWTSGNANCRADLYYIANAGGGTVHYLSNLTFDATAP